MIETKPNVFTFRDARITDNFERNFDYVAIQQARRAMIHSIRRLEEDALKRAVCRYFSVSDPFEVVKRCQCITYPGGDRRYICLDDGVDIIRFYKLRTSNKDGKVFAHMDYRTFDGVA